MFKYKNLYCSVSKPLRWRPLVLVQGKVHIWSGHLTHLLAIHLLPRTTGHPMWWFLDTSRYSVDTRKYTE